MTQVNQQVNAGDKLYLYGSFNSDPVVFYRGAAINELDLPGESVAAMIGKGDYYLIMTQQSWRGIQKMTSTLCVPLLAERRTRRRGGRPAGVSASRSSIAENALFVSITTLLFTRRLFGNLSSSRIFSVLILHFNLHRVRYPYPHLGTVYPKRSRVEPDKLDQDFGWLCCGSFMAYAAAEFFTIARAILVRNISRDCRWHLALPIG